MKSKEIEVIEATIRFIISALFDRFLSTGIQHHADTDVDLYSRWKVGIGTEPAQSCIRGLFCLI